MARAADAYDRSVRFAHALYGAIIITAELVLERNHADDAAEVLWVLLATGLVLLLAHSYSTLVARRADGQPHRLGEGSEVLVEELPVLTSLVVPVAMFVLAQLDVISLTAAFRISIGSAVLFLFVIGLWESRRNGQGRIASVLIGLIGAAIGVAVILLEVWIS